jgi:hypothetical protein
MAVQREEPADEITVEAVATKIDDGWTVDIDGEPGVAIRVRTLADVDAAVDQALRRRRGIRQHPVRVHIYAYR